MRILVVPILALFCALRVTAQHISLFDPDASGFPIVRAKCYAFDATGTQVRPSASEITVTEEGTPRAVLSVSCPPPTPLKALSSVLVFDVSGSMAANLAGTRRLDLAKTAARAWIDALPLGQSECAITSFDQHNYLNQDFTTDRTRLLDAVETLAPSGGTDYDQGLYQPVAGGLQVSSRGVHRRVVMFLTDGTASVPKIDDIVTEAARQNCLIFAVTIDMACPQSLKDIATRTGGEWFENVTTVPQAEEIYYRILQETQGGAPCEMTWQSDVSCTAGRRTALVSWKGQTRTVEYDLPTTAVETVTIAPSSIYFRSKPLAQKADTTVTITAEGAPITVTGITSSNPAFDITPKSFTLPAGGSRSLTVSYTPSDSGYNWTQFDISMEHCAGQYFAAGAYPGGRPSTPTVKLEHPNGGETFVAGSDTVVTWSGIPLSDTVTLEYSTDNGTTWRAITEEATGGRHPWHVPNAPSDFCLVRVRQPASAGGGSLGGWTKRIVGTGFDAGNSIAVDGAGNVYVTGVFSSTADADGTLLTGSTGSNVFIAKYRPDGTLDWAKSITGTGDRQSTKIIVDNAGALFVTGSFRGTIDFGNGIQKTSFLTSQSDMFVAKFSTDGTAEWAQSAFSTGNTVANSVAVDNAGNVYTTGSFTRTIRLDTIRLTTPYDLSAPDMFIAKCRPNGSAEWVVVAGGSLLQQGNDLVVGTSGDIFVTGQFYGSTTFGSTKLIPTASNGSDIFVAKYHPDGTCEWAQKAGGSVDKGKGIALDPSGNIIVIGDFFDIALFGSHTVRSVGSSDIFVAKYRPDGACEWVQRGGGTDMDWSYGVTVDRAGNIYAAGQFLGIAEFGGIDYKTKGEADIFLAKYGSTGNLEGVETFGGSSYDFAQALAMDSLGTLHVTGVFTGTVDFPDGRLTGVGGRDAFVWKVGEEVRQSDVSDATFSIVAPSATALDVDMGRVVVGSMKDSVVSSLVSNVGSWPFSVSNILILGGDANQFSLVSGLPPFSVDPAASHPVEFRFEPSTVGPKSAQLAIVTQTDTLFQTISGEAVAPSLAIVEDLIDFGLVLVGGSRDSLRAVTVANVGTAPLSITATRHAGPNDADFSTLLGGGPFTLDPGDTARLDLRFAPSAVGRTSGRLLFDYGGTGSPATILLFGEGVDSLLSSPSTPAEADIATRDFFAVPGETIDIPILLDRQANLVHSGATVLTTTLRFNKTLLAPIDQTPLGTVDGNDRLIPLTLPIEPTDGNVLAVLRFRAALGNDTVTTLTLENPGSSGASVTVRTESGTFHLLGVCREGEARLFDPSGGTGGLKIRPNPAGEEMEIEVGTPETGHTRLVVVDLLGREVMSLLDAETAAGERTVRANVRGLAEGSYYLLLTTPTTRRVERLDIAR